MKRALALAVGTLLMVGCASRAPLVTNETYYELEPVRALDIDNSLLPVNLIVRVHNVADMGRSYKNRFELKVNGRLIEPVTEVSNVQSDYEYHLKLQPGYYEVKGTYYGFGGWEEERAEVRTRDLVRVEPGRRTVLEATIRKNWDGTPADDVMYFTVSYEPIGNPLNAARTGTVAAGTTSEAGTGVQKSSESRVRVEVPEGEQMSRSGPPGVLRGRPVMLQINTDPEGCDVIVDDQKVGQAPLKIWIDSSTNHVVQISRPGYRSVFRYLDASRLRSEEQITLIERLEKKE